MGTGGMKPGGDMKEKIVQIEISIESQQSGILVKWGGLVLARGAYKDGEAFVLSYPNNLAIMLRDCVRRGMGDEDS